MRKKMLTDLIITNKESLYRLAYSYVKNKEDALDIVQDSIHKALKTVHTLEDTEKLKSWFIRIVINTSLDILRKNKREVLVDEDILEFVSPKMIDQYENIDLIRLLEKLTPEYRIIIILKYFEDLTLREIAEILKENENTVKTRLYKGLKMLKLEVKNEFLIGGY